MKVLFVSNNLKSGGKERQIFYLLQSLSKKGIKVGLLLRFPNTDFDLNSIRNLELYISKNSTKKKFFNYYKSVVKTFNPDIIHAWEGVITTLSIPIKLLYRKKLINGQFRYSKKFPLFSIMAFLQFTNSLFSNRNISNTLSGLKSARLKRNKKNIVIPNGYDFNDLVKVNQCTNKPNDEITICKVANFTNIKDHLSLIQASVNIIKKGYTIHVKFIGDGKEKEVIENSIHVEYKEHFQFLGYRNDVLNIINKADICVLLSKKGHSEGMSNAIMEYMLSGKPVIATKTGGNPEMVKNGNTGYLVDFENIEQIEQCLIQLITNSEKRKQLGENAREFALANFNIGHVCNQYINLYNSVLFR